MGYTSFQDFWDRGGQILIGAIGGLVIWNALIWWLRRKWWKSQPHLACSQCKKSFLALGLRPCAGCGEHICQHCRYMMTFPHAVMEIKKAIPQLAWCVACAPEGVKKLANLAPDL